MPEIQKISLELKPETVRRMDELVAATDRRSRPALIDWLVGVAYERLEAGERLSTTVESAIQAANYAG